jgi:hypothetical protein
MLCIVKLTAMSWLVQGGVVLLTLPTGVRQEYFQ